jgi:hypothetical protein
MLHFAKMEQEMTRDVYRSAYETAMTELGQITIRFDQLRTRKSHIENLIVVLQQSLSKSELAPTETLTTMEMISAPSPRPGTLGRAEQEPDPENYSFLQVPNPISDHHGPSPLAESNGDPFQRRVRSSFRFKGISAQRSY